MIHKEFIKSFVRFNKSTISKSRCKDKRIFETGQNNL
jgi:hypothetical protein